MEATPLLHLWKGSRDRSKKADKDRVALAPIVNRATRDKSAIVSFLNSFILIHYHHNIGAGLLSLVDGIVMMLIYVFIKLVLDIGQNRYFLESRKYRKTKIEKILFPYRTKRTIYLALIIFVRNIYQTLWNLTIIGGIIKHYEYLMIPYVLAENLIVSRKETFNISKGMMKGLK